MNAGIQSLITALSKSPMERNDEDEDIIYTGLRQMHLFSKTKASRVHGLASVVTHVAAPAGTIIIHQGEEGTFWYGIIRGIVSVHVKDMDDDSMSTSIGIEVARLHEGQGLGDTSLLTDEPRSATVKTETDCDFFRIGKEDFKRFSDLVLLDEMNNLSRIDDHSPSPTLGPKTQFDRTPSPALIKLVKSASSKSLQKELQTPSATSSTASSTVNISTPLDSNGSSNSDKKPPMRPISIIIDSATGSMTDSLPEDPTILPSPRVDPLLQERLAKNPQDRTEDDLLDILQELNQLKAISHLPITEKRQLASIVRFKEVKYAGEIVFHQGDMGSSWYILAQGSVEVVVNKIVVCSLSVGESFGESLIKEPALRPSTILTKEDDCQFIVIEKEDYDAVFSNSANFTKVIKEGNDVVMVLEKRVAEQREGYVVMNATMPHLLQYLVDQADESDVHFVEDFLLTFRTFMSPLTLWEYLFEKFKRPSKSQLSSPIHIVTIRSKLIAIILAWVRYYFSDFEDDKALLNQLEIFVEVLAAEKLHEQRAQLREEIDSNKLQKLNSPASPASPAGGNAGSAGGSAGSAATLSPSPTSSAPSPSKTGRSTRSLSLVNKDAPTNIFLPPMHANVNSDKLFRGTLKSSQRKERRASATLVYDRSTLSGSSVVRGGPDMDVIRVYRSDESYKTLAIQKLTTAAELVETVLAKFNITDETNYKLVEVKLDGTQRVFGPDEASIVSQLSLNGRLYIRKSTSSTESLASASPFASISARSSTRRTSKSQSQSLEVLAEETLKPAPLPTFLSDPQRESPFLELDDRDIARQITLKDFDLFSSIESTEYIYFLWKQTNRNLSNLHIFAQRFNQINFWVVTEICSTKNLMKRASVVKKFISIAKDLLSCNNYNSAFAVISGLGNVAVSRLHETWEKLPQRVQEEFGYMQELLDPSRNMKTYRNLLAQTKPPSIPFFPIFMKDLTFIREGNETKIEGRINFDMLRMIGRTIRAIEYYRSAVYEESNLLPGRRRRTTVGSTIELTGNPLVISNSVKDYLSNLVVIDDQRKLGNLSRECEESAKKKPRPSIVRR